jgi:hypothetical protein
MWNIKGGTLLTEECREVTCTGNEAFALHYHVYEHICRKRRSNFSGSDHVGLLAFQKETI